MLSVIVPFCNEYPQVLFTIQSIAQELKGRADFEILAVDNYCDDVAAQGRENDKGGDAIAACTKGNPWLKYLKYTEKLSHWQAKNYGVKQAAGDVLWFCDAHCVVSRDSLWPMYEYYKNHHNRLNGTLHLPLTYKILEWHSLIYKLLNEIDHGSLEYRFTPFRPAVSPYRVPCMSTCGMMMTREIYDKLGGWPAELGIYGGGEHFINFTLAVLGRTVNIFPAGPLFHHGEKRGYEWNYDDYTRNRTIATYVFGGQALAERFIAHRKGDKVVLRGILSDVIIKCAAHRRHIKHLQKMSIEHWLTQFY
ncbi:glycosyltransferase [Patescibacteria group bacterium]|uniref:Putative glycosyltransferase n=1 Tax=viral metagenome TaxID=1070528 RepID=A0A6M3KQ30_9ZZZZ|nr:glycosyltransferase [Patescibacteria group bacterium]